MPYKGSLPFPLNEQNCNVPGEISLREAASRRLHGVSNCNCHGHCKDNRCSCKGYKYQFHDYNIY